MMEKSRKNGFEVDKKGVSGRQERGIRQIKKGYQADKKGVSGRQERGIRQIKNSS